jgi:hypothetical protein
LDKVVYKIYPTIVLEVAALMRIVVLVIVAISKGQISVLLEVYKQIANQMMPKGNKQRKKESA